MEPSPRFSCLNLLKSCAWHRLNFSWMCINCKKRSRADLSGLSAASALLSVGLEYHISEHSQWWHSRYLTFSQLMKVPPPEFSITEIAKKKGKKIKNFLSLLTSYSVTYRENPFFFFFSPCLVGEKTTDICQVFKVSIGSSALSLLFKMMTCSSWKPLPAHFLTHQTIIHFGGKHH